MRTQEEIVDHIKNTSDSEDFFGVQRSDWIDFLDFDHVKEFLKEGVTKEDWDSDRKENTVKGIRSAILDYLPFAWEKANNCRGLSASRSIAHMSAFLWLLGEDELSKKFDETEYEHYGKEKLIVISEAIGFNWKEIDDGVRTNNG